MVAIKDIEMPEGCAWCFACNYNDYYESHVCDITDKVVMWDEVERAESCPLVEIDENE